MTLTKSKQTREEIIEKLENAVIMITFHAYKRIIERVYPVDIVDLCEKLNKLMPVTVGMNSTDSDIFYIGIPEIGGHLVIKLDTYTKTNGKNDKNKEIKQIVATTFIPSYLRNRPIL